MIHFEGNRTFSLPVSQVHAKLGDASFLVSCLKDVDELVETCPDRAIWKLRPGFSFMRGTLEITMDVTERTVPSSVKVKIFSRGIGSTSTVLATLSLQPQEAGSSVHWYADLTETTGLLKMVPKSLISSAAGKVIEETWTEIEKKLHS
jgi:carbon monoxide dehydrogenase subunit G